MWRALIVIIFTCMVLLTGYSLLGTCVMSPHGMVCTHNKHYREELKSWPGSTSHTLTTSIGNYSYTVNYIPIKQINEEQLRRVIIN